ncbi:MAG: VCBS repeat-containing protein [Anaerolineae bacterium]|nr:VCBS repeat-containing protein [Anaerolineae bacterium]
MPSKTNQKSVLHKLMSGCVLFVLLMTPTFQAAAANVQFAPVAHTMAFPYLLPVTIKETAPHLGDPYGDETPPTMDTLPPQPKLDFVSTDRLAELYQKVDTGFSSTSVTLSQTVDPGDNDGQENSAYNGSFITYTIEFANSEPYSFTNIVVIDYLPPNALDNITATSSANITWTFGYEATPITDPSNRVITITTRREVRWYIPELLSGEKVSVTLSGRVIGQPEYSSFINRIFAFYDVNGVSGGAINGEELALTALVRIEGMGISSVPTWQSADIGGTISQDWGDFDRDGDLDLALGSALGTTIYLNNKGTLEPFYTSPRYENDRPRASYGVRWSDFDPSTPQLELIAIGEVDREGIPLISGQPGLNYFYKYDQTTARFVSAEVLTSTAKLMRVEAGDFDGDGDIDIVASTNVLNATCPIVLYRNDGTGHFVNSDLITQTVCLSDKATAALGPADFDHDGDLDLAIGVFPNVLRVLRNGVTGAGPLTMTNPFTRVTVLDIDTKLQYVPYDLAWGDYNDDGFLDLAAAYPLQRLVRIYENQDNTALKRINATIRTIQFFTPLSLDWGDFNGDRRLEIVVPDTQPGIYQYDDATQRFVKTIGIPYISGQTWSVRGIDISGKHNLDLVLTNRDGPSIVFSALTPKLNSKLTLIDSQNTASVGFGDYDNDGDFDLLFGSGRTELFARLWVNNDGIFDKRRRFFSSGLGPQYVAFGDMTNDSMLDMAIGTVDKLQVYHNTQVDNTTNDINISPATVRTQEYQLHSVAWGDADDDGLLDMLISTENAAGKGVVKLYLNGNTGLATEPSFSIEVSGTVSSLVWGDVDKNYYLDFAMGIDDGPTSVYTNQGDASFTLAWTSPLTTPQHTSSIDWADYDNDGDLDLAVGNKGTYDYVWENTGHTFGDTPVCTFTTAFSKTTSVAWGDWNNDGYPELAIGKEDANDVIYENRTSTPGVCNLRKAWESSAIVRTTGLAWGDYDHDGDMDLAVSRDGTGGGSGVYENTTVIPTHYARQANQNRLPNTPPYVSIERPGNTDDGYLFSSAKVIAGPLQPTVNITYTLYDPDKNAVVDTLFEYSLSGGSMWKKATPVSTTQYITQPSRIGTRGVFIWDAKKDQAISDNARFRIQVLARDSGTAYSASNGGISPPYRVRATTCVWPNVLSIDVRDVKTGNLISPHTTIMPGQEIRLEGRVTEVSDSVTYYWDFGDGTATTGTNWRTDPYSYTERGTYTVTLTVKGTPCPIARPGFSQRLLFVGVIDPSYYTHSIYLPLVMKSYTSQALLIPLTYPADQSETEILQVENVVQTPVAYDTTQPQTYEFLPSSTTLATTTYENAILVATRLRSDDVNNEPDVNAKGNRITFWSTDGAANDGNIEVFLINVNDEGEPDDFALQLTNSEGSILGGFNLGPTINNDGTRVAFFADQNLDDGVATNALINHSGVYTTFEQQNIDNNFEIFMAVVEPGDTQATLVQVTNTPNGVNILPAISGDGQFVTFASDVDLAGTNEQTPGAGGIYRAEITTTDNITWYINYTTVAFAQPEPNQPAIVYDQPDISPDGRYVTFISNQDPLGQNPEQNLEIFLAEIENNTVKEPLIQVTQSFTDSVNEQPSISVSDEGIRIAFISTADYDGSNPLQYRQVFVQNITLTPTLSLSATTHIPTQETNQDYDQPNISASGKRVAYISEADEALHIYDSVVNNDIVSPSTAEGYASPAFSANGTNVVFAGADWDIYRATYPLSDLAVAKFVEPDKAKEGDVLMYTLVITNLGPSPAAGVVLTDVLPQGLEATPPQGTTFIHDEVTDFSGSENHHSTKWETPSLELDFGVATTLFELPNDCSADKWADMTGNVLLLHLNETSGPPFTFNDSSCENNDAMCSSCPTVGASGKLDKALQFYGGRYIYVPYHASLYPGLHPWSVATWVKTQNTYGTIFSQDSSYLADFYQISVENGKAVFRMNLGDGEFSIASASNINDNLWHHIVAVRSGIRTIQLYVDGALEATVTGNVSYQYLEVDQPIFIGQGFTGYIDEMAMFDHALTVNEINVIYQQQAPQYTGYFDSHVITYTAGAWGMLGWIPSQAVGKELPNNQATESGYGSSTGGISMNNNTVLLHLNEPLNSMYFADNSGNGNYAYCYGDSCPHTGNSGRLGYAPWFDGANDFLYNWGYQYPDTYAISLWFKTTCANCGIFSTLYQYYYYPGYNDKDLYLSNGALCSKLYVDSPLCAPDNYADGKWHHVVHTYGASTVWLYVDGVAYSHPKVGALYTYYNYLGYSFQATQPYFQGSLDEVAIFHRTLASDEAQNLYRRGITDMKFQARTFPYNALGVCDPSASTLPFTGPGGSPATYYTDDALQPTPYPLNVAGNPCFQYRVYMDSDQLNQTPELMTVTVSTQINCTGTSTLVCYLSTEEAPLAAGTTLRVQFPATVTQEAFSHMQVINGQYGIVNTAVVASPVIDHEPDNNESLPVITALTPVTLTSIVLNGDSTGVIDTDYNFTATVAAPSGNPTPPVQYVWSTDVHAPVTNTLSSGLYWQDVMTYSWSTYGVHTVTVRASNTNWASSRITSSNITINYPAATISTLYPNTIDVCHADFPLTITGTNFFAGYSAVGWTGEPNLTPSAITSNRLTVTIPSSYMNTPGTYNVTVINPINIVSNATVFNVTNNRPTVGNIIKAANEDNDITFAAIDFTTQFTDTDTCQSLVQVEIVSLPANGTLKLGASNVSMGDVIPVGSLNNLLFTPNANWNGITTFNWNGSDGTDYASANAVVTMTINPVNDAPMAVDDNYSVANGGTLTRNATLGVRANDSDVEDPQSALIVGLIQDVAYGNLTLNTNGSFSYTNVITTATSDSFTYQLTDTGGLTNTATVNITITP